MNERIKELNKLIEQEQEKISKCSHKWGSAYSNPEKTTKPSGFTLERQGSDCWVTASGYTDYIIPRWTRVCSVCGKEEHTYKTIPIVTGEEPFFSK